MLNFNEIEFELNWEDGMPVVLSAWHLVECRDLTEEEIQWFEENEKESLAYLAREQLL